MTHSHEAAPGGGDITSSPTAHEVHAADRRLGGRLALAGLAAFLVAVPFALLLLMVKANFGPLQRLDLRTAASLNRWARENPDVVDLLEITGGVTDPFVFRALVLAAAVWLWRRGARRLAGWAVATTALGGILGVVLKVVVLRARPSFDEPIAEASGYSFPSGHALNSFLCVGVLILVFLPVLRRRGRMLAVLLGTFVVLITGFDRIGLGVHFVSDVVAGWVVALACLAATAAGFEIWRREEGLPPSPVSEGVDPEARPEMTDDSPSAEAPPGSVRG